ncbi:MAG: VWA domain-containing protein [Thermoanaerobaculia bacterium]
MNRPMSLLVASLLFVSPLLAQTAPATPSTSTEQKDFTIQATPLGDRDGDVVMRMTFRYTLASDIPQGTPVFAQGSVLVGGKVVRNFRRPLQPSDASGFTMIASLPAGKASVEIRLLTELEAGPMILAKATQEFEVQPVGKPYVADAADGPEAFIAEGVVPESAGAVHILPPKRNLAPNLFSIDVETKPPVERVEFWVEGKKIQTRNRPPFHAELDLGEIPKRVEVRAVGYDGKGHYVDADAFVVNERENPVEAKITRTVTADGISHFKVSVQNNSGTSLKSVALFADDHKLVEWDRPPYALDLPTADLKGYQFVRVSAWDTTGYEASDLVYLDGSHYSEQIEVNYVELPVTVLDASGVAVTDLKKEDFEVLENGKKQKIANFGFATNLPLSVGVLVDHSGSMQPRIETARKAALEFFTDIVRPGDRAFFGGFSWDASKISPLVSDVGALSAQVEGMPDAEGGTALYDAIISGLYRFRSVPGRKALVIVTDGEDTASRIGYDEMLSYVRAARVPIYFIGIGMSSIGSGRIKGLAAETGGISYFIRNIEQLKPAYAELEKELRSQYLIGYYTESGKKDTDYRTVEVKTDRPGVRVRTIRGYIP